MSEKERLSPFLSLDPAATTRKPWWADLFLGRDHPPPPARQRPVWTAQIRDSHRSLFGSTGRPASLFPLTTFYGLLGDGLEQAQRRGESLAVVVVQLPDLGISERRLQREMEIALRLSVRGDDLPARLAPTALAVALPRTGDSAGVVALRLQRVLSRLAGARVATGMASFPTDGNTSLALLRVATWRSLTALSGSYPEPDPELTRLLGPLNPSGVERLSSVG